MTSQLLLRFALPAFGLLSLCFLGAGAWALPVLLLMLAGAVVLRPRPPEPHPSSRPTSRPPPPDGPPSPPLRVAPAMSALELTQAEALLLHRKVQAIERRLADDPRAHAVRSLLAATGNATSRVRRSLSGSAGPIRLYLTADQAEMALRAIEYAGGPVDRSAREQTRHRLRHSGWSELQAHPGLSLMKKLLHDATP